MRISLLSLLLTSAASVFSPAFAQENAAERGTTVFTLRPQMLFYKWDLGNEVAQIPALGAQIQHSPAGSNFSYSISALYGEAEGSNSDYIFPNEPSGPPLRVNQEYAITRTEVHAYVEYTPDASPVTFMFGARYLDFRTEWDDVFTVASNDAPTSVIGYGYGGSEWIIPAVGVRISGRLGPESRHALTGQAVVSYGPAEFSTGYESYNTSTDTVINSDAGSVSDEEVNVELAIGYSYFLTDRVAVGVRGRAFVTNLDAYGRTYTDPLTARNSGSDTSFATEFNISWRL